MARKYSAKKRMSKIEPAMQTIAISMPIGGASPVNQFIDLSQVASLVNRRFYRQGINWAVAGFKFITPATITGELSIAKLPNTWTMSNSWEKGFRAWQRMNNESLEETESVRPRFLDFKVYANSAHHAAGYAANLLPYASAGVYTTGEWEPSKIVVPFGPASPGNTTDFEVIATGSSFPGAGASGINAVSLIEGYAASRALPEIRDPNVPDDARDIDGSTPENWLSAIFNDGVDQDSEVVADMFENNKAPYPFENDGVNTDTMYPGGANQGSGLEVHDLAFISGTTIGGVTRLKGGNFPCGLINIAQTNVSAPSVALLFIDLIPGNHRGYLCEPMTEM